jgi:transcriptional regulator with XRE-family HTH domain
MPQEILRPIHGLTHLRTTLGKSVREVARESGLSSSTVIRLESGANPTPNANDLIRRWIASQTEPDTIINLVLAIIQTREPTQRIDLLDNVIIGLTRARIDDARTAIVERSVW